MFISRFNRDFLVFVLVELWLLFDVLHTQNALILIQSFSTGENFVYKVHFAMWHGVNYTSYRTEFSLTEKSHRIKRVKMRRMHLDRGVPNALSSCIGRLLNGRRTKEQWIIWPLKLIYTLGDRIFGVLTLIKDELNWLLCDLVVRCPMAPRSEIQLQITCQFYAPRETHFREHWSLWYNEVWPK